jgi:hypothetical protein
LTDALPGQVRFVRCLFSDVEMRGWADTAAEFVDCRFTGRLDECKFWGAPRYQWLEPGALRPPRTTNDFRGNDFRDADIGDVEFLGGVDLSLQRLPEGPQYARIDRTLERIAWARDAVSLWPKGPDRDEAMIMLDVYDDESMEGQAEMFVNRWATGVPREIADRVWHLLETAKRVSSP